MKNKINLCNCGCGTEIRPGFLFVNGHNRRGKKQTKESVLKMRKKIIEKWKDPNSKYNSKEFRSNMNKCLIGRKRGPMSDDQKIKISKTMIGIKYSDEWKEKQRMRMLSGHAVYMNKCIKNPSKPEVMLREIVKELYPSCIFQYKLLNYALDVAIPEYKIAIEYDGWYHFDCKEHIDYHKNREQRIKDEKWNIIKYTIFEKFPSKERIKNDIEVIIYNRRNQCQK